MSFQKFPINIPAGTIDGEFFFINALSDLPAPDAFGVITLVDNATYFFIANVDLQGNRMVAGQNTTILGTSSENVRLTSTGLTDPLISSAWSMPMRNIAIEAYHGVSLDATVNPNQALDWFGVNFVNCTKIGDITSYSNVIWSDCAVLNSKSLVFDGTFGTVGFTQCLFDASAGGTLINLAATVTFTRRFRIIYSSFVVLAGETGINFPLTATVPVEGYILDTVNFGGGGTYTTGYDHTDNQVLWINCKGVVNSGNIAQYYMTANATATVVGATNTFYKVAGTTSAGAYVEKFTLSNNRADYDGALTGFYKVTAILTLQSGNNHQVRVRIGKDGTTTPESEGKTTTSGSGRSENVTISSVFELQTGNYIEVFVANGTATTDITVEDMNVIIERLN